MHKRIRAHGFTLVELIVVISVIVILTALSIVMYNVVVKQSHDTKRQNDMTALANALEIYYQKNGEYPAGCLLAASPCVTYTTASSGSTNNDPSSFTTVNATQINASTTLTQLKSILPGIDSSFGDPSSTSGTQLFVNNTATTPQKEYIYIGGITNTTGTSRNFYVDYNGADNTHPINCQIWVSNLQPSQTSNYIIGYFSEQDSLWHLRQGNHGSKFVDGNWKANPPTKNLFCWGGQANAVWSN